MLPVGGSADTSSKVGVVVGAVCSHVVESQDDISGMVLVIGNPEMGQSGAEVGNLAGHPWRRLVGKDEGANRCVDGQQALAFLAEDRREFDNGHRFREMCVRVKWTWEL